MKRLHVHVSVNEIAESVRFYSTLFGADPTVTKIDYAKWMLDDPRVNFAISTGEHDRRGIEHLGIQVENEGELAEVYGRLAQADRPVLDEGATVCCYAKSEKSWIADPQGVVWETFHTTGEAVTYGASPELEKLASDKAAGGACCAPVLAGKPAATGCCG
jgi:catechol 2,3-dioxygenase-like lactoylglutathione lyase family enzyme